MSSPPLVAALVKRELPFGWSPLLVGILQLAAHEERALPSPVTWIRLPHVLPPCPPGSLVTIPVFLQLRGGWFACPLLWRQ